MMNLKIKTMMKKNLFVFTLLLLALNTVVAQENKAFQSSGQLIR